MKAYKATRNLKCQSITFEVGKTYTFNGELIMCQQGFHFCKNPKDILKWYPYDKDFILLEIDVLGKIIDNEDKDKSLTDQFKVVRIISKEEYPELLGITLDSNGNKVKEVDHNGNTCLYEYDSNGNKVKEVYPNGDTYLWEYDSNGNMVKQVYPNGNTHLWEYDSNGNKVKQVCLNGDTWTITITN